MPLAFKWGSDIPIAGQGFEQWVDSLKRIDSSSNFLLFHSYYFRDEAESIEKSKELGNRRMARMINYLGLTKEKTMFETIAKDVQADVRSHPFKALTYEVISVEDALKSSGDTMEVCFLIKDSLSLPHRSLEGVEKWLNQHEDKKSETIHLIGTADGTGISESADVAWERANVIKEKVIRQGWHEQLIIINTGQRNQSMPVRNRCVLIYFNE